MVINMLGDNDLCIITTQHRTLLLSQHNVITTDMTAKEISRKLGLMLKV